MVLSRQQSGVRFCLSSALAPCPSSLGPFLHPRGSRQVLLLQDGSSMGCPLRPGSEHPEPTFPSPPFATGLQPGKASVSLT